MDNEINSAAEDAAERLSGRSVACAESFTGGLASQALASVEGSADWFRGGVVAYNTETKRRVLGVGSEPVISERCAVAMARGVRDLMDAEVAIYHRRGRPFDPGGQRPGHDHRRLVGAPDRLGARGVIGRGAALRSR